MKDQQAAFDKILPGVQARCAVFFLSISKNMVIVRLMLYGYIFELSKNMDKVDMVKIMRNVKLKINIFI